MPCNVAVTHDGLEALDYVRQRGDFRYAPTPQLILLDLNMPRMDGKEFLMTIKQIEGLRDIPVILLTSSQAQHDIQECYQLNASGYFVKPANLNEFADMAKRVEDFMADGELCEMLRKHG
jgi:CheY-like chemotaxis protein